MRSGHSALGKPDATIDALAYLFDFDGREREYVDYEYVILEKRDQVGWITINRPAKLNTINRKTGDEILDALHQCEYDPEVRAIVLRGAGRSFCAGDEIGRPTDEREEREKSADRVQHYAFGPGRWTTIIYKMRHIAKPIIAMVQGHAYGAGFNLAMGCDFRIAADNALFCTPFVKRGMGTGSNLLQQYVGIGRALEMALLGEPIDAQEALRLGLATRVVPLAQLEAYTAEFAGKLAQGPTAVIGLSKLAIYRGWDVRHDEAYVHQGVAQEMSRQTADREEGIQAFREKRPPRFTGR